MVNDNERVSCEEDGSCDDSCTPPARDDCTVESVPTEAETTQSDVQVSDSTEQPIMETLPYTGIEPIWGWGLGLIIIGTGMIKAVRYAGT